MLLNQLPVTNDISLMLNNVCNRCGVAYCYILIVIIIIDNSFIDLIKFNLFNLHLSEYFYYKINEHKWLILEMNMHYSLTLSIKMSILLMIDLKMILPFDYKID